MSLPESLFTCDNCGFQATARADLPVTCICGNLMEPTTSPRPKRRGPGTHLKTIIPTIFSKEGCGCKAYARKMDRWGADGCEKKFDEIVTHLLRKGGWKGRLPFAQKIIEGWVKEAIELSKGNRPKPIQDNGDWFIAVTTSPRKSCTLQTCVDSIRRAGWEPTIFAEPESTETDCQTIWNESKKGVWHNWLHSVQWSLENTNSPLILTVQDDSLFHPDSRVFTESVLWPSDNAGFVSLYTPKHYTIQKDETVHPPGVNKINTSCLWGACALAWKRETLEQLVNTKTAKTWLGIRPKRKDKSREERDRAQRIMEARKVDHSLINNSDAAIGKIVRGLGKTMWFIDPSPVQHIATHSTINHGGNGGRRNCWRCADHLLPLKDQVFPND